MNFRDIVNMVVARITSNLLKLIILRLSNSQPDHSIRDSLQHRNISDIQVNDRWRLVNRHLIRPSFQLMFVVEQINAGPRVCLKSRRVVWVIGVFLEPPRPSRRSILISLQLVPRILHTNLPCCHSPCLRHRRLNLKYQKSVLMAFNISDKMVDVIDDLGKVRMGGVIDISQVNKPRLVYSHASVVNAVNNLNPFELFDQVEHVVPVNQEPLLLVVLHDFRIFLV